MSDQKKSPSQQDTSHKLGTFAGVFTPSILTILGIILFLRLGYVVGSAGIKQALLIILIANLISVLTSLSLSAVATNLTVRGGGDYYLISRTLGLEFGGALGLVLFLAQSVSIAFYCIGFAEVMVSFWGGSAFSAQMIALLAIAALFVLAWQGADWATRFQYVVMGLLCAALLSFYLGGLSGWDAEVFQTNWNNSGQEGSFWLLFAVFFPAVTGFTQGVSMSGDLRDPGKSLPTGTLLAVGLSIAVYFSAALLFAGNLPAAILSADYSAMGKMSWLPILITLGVFAATLSSAMASFLGAPRILQSLAGDKIFPLLNPFAKGYGPGNNPRRAVLLAAVIAVMTTALGNLNLIASVVAMFFLISYGLLNYATWFEARAASPSFRPRFRWFHKNASLAGAIICLLAMLAVDWKAGTMAVAVIFAIRQYLQIKVPQARWADSRRSYHLQQVREHLLQIVNEPDHPRDWRPHLLIYSDDRQRRSYLLHFADWIAGASGMVTLLRILTEEGAGRHQQKELAEHELQDDIAALGVQAFPLVINADDFSSANRVALQAYGIGPLKANTIVVNQRSFYALRYFSRGASSYGLNLREALRLGYNLIVLDVDEQSWQQAAVCEPELRQIDIIYNHSRSDALMLMLGYLMTRHDFWSRAHLRILVVAGEDGAASTHEEMIEHLEQVRIEADVEVVADLSACLEAAAQSHLVMLPVNLKDGDLYTSAQQKVDAVLPHLPLSVMVLAGEDIQLDAEPEEGEAGLLAAAEDRYSSSQQRLKNAQKQFGETKSAYDRQLQTLLAAQRDAEKSAEELGQLEAQLESCGHELDKASRYVAKAETLSEQSLKNLEEVREAISH